MRHIYLFDEAGKCERVVSGGDVDSAEIARRNGAAYFVESEERRDPRTVKYADGEMQILPPPQDTDDQKRAKECPHPQRQLDALWELVDAMASKRDPSDDALAVRDSMKALHKKYPKR